jgi:hypothetical protein
MKSIFNNATLVSMYIGPITGGFEIFAEFLIFGFAPLVFLWMFVCGPMVAGCAEACKVGNSDIASSSTRKAFKPKPRRNTEQRWAHAAAEAERSAAPEASRIARPGRVLRADSRRRMSLTNQLCAPAGAEPSRKRVVAQDRPIAPAPASVRAGYAGRGAADAIVAAEAEAGAEAEAEAAALMLAEPSAPGGRRKGSLMGRLGAVFGKPSDDGGEARADEPDEESQLQEVSQAQAALRGASPLRSSQKRMPQEASQLEVQELSQAQAAHRGASPKRLSRQRMSQQRTQRLDVDSGAVSGPEGDSGRNEMKLESSTKNVCTARRRGSAEAARSNEVEDASGEPISAMQRFANRRKRGSLDNRSSHLMDSMDHVTKSKPMHRSSAWRKRRGSSDCASDMVVSGNAPAPASEATVRTPRFAAGGRT